VETCRRWIAVAVALFLGGCSSSSDDAAPAAPAAGGGRTLDEVRARGVIRVGVNDQLPGFGFIRPDGTFGGFDIDFGRALAAAIFGDATAVQFVGVSASNRFEALRAREIDVLIRNTTWTLTRPGRRRSSGCRMSGRVPRRAARTRWSSCRTPSRRNRWRQSPAPTMRDGRTSRYREQPE
jgi:hypothetical protein